MREGSFVGGREAGTLGGEGLMREGSVVGGSEAVARWHWAGGNDPQGGMDLVSVHF